MMGRGERGRHTLRAVSRWAAVAALSFGCGAALAQTRIPPSPSDFATTVSQNGEAEAMAARVALIQGVDPRVRAFADTMLRDHAGSAEGLRQAAAAAGLPPPPPGLSGDGAALLSALQSLQGHDFDRAYARQQVVAHAAALAVEDSFAEAGAEPLLRQAAQADLPLLRDHLKAARQLDTAIGDR